MRTADSIGVFGAKNCTQLAYDLRDRARCWNGGEQLNVISYSSYGEKHDLLRGCDLPQRVPDFFRVCDERKPALGAEHAMNVIEVVCVRHECGPLRGQGSTFSRVTPGLRPGLKDKSPLRSAGIGRYVRMNVIEVVGVCHQCGAATRPGIYLFTSHPGLAPGAKRPVAASWRVCWTCAGRSALSEQVYEIVPDYCALSALFCAAACTGAPAGWLRSMNMVPDGNFRFRFGESRNIMPFLACCIYRSSSR